MKNIILILLVTNLSSCMIMPLCLRRNDDCGCDHSRNIKLSQRTKRKIAIDWHNDYTLLLKKKKTLRKLKRFTRKKEFRSFYDEQAKSDTLKIDVMKTDFPRFKDYIVRQIHLHRIVIIDKKTGQKLKAIKRRKFNLHCKDSYYGAGGKEYGDPAARSVIIKKMYWIS